jgi:hypothetical protein
MGRFGNDSGKEAGRGESYIASCIKYTFPSKLLCHLFLGGRPFALSGLRGIGTGSGLDTRLNALLLGDFTEQSEMQIRYGDEKAYALSRRVLRLGLAMLGGELQETANG